MEETDNINGVLPVSNSLIDFTILLEWQKWFLSQGYSLDSLDTYYSILKRFVRFTDKINQKEVDKFLQENKGPVSSAALKSFFNFLHYKKDFSSDILNIRFEKNRSSRKMPKTISYNEVQLIINNMDSLRDKMLTMITYELGLRISEALRLTWDKFNWSEWIQDKTQWGKVSLEHTKRNKFRVLPVRPDIMNMLYDNHKNRTTTGIPIGNNIFDFDILDFVKNKDKNKHEFQIHDYLAHADNIYRKKLYKVSLEAIGKKISCHVLRHAKAQHLLDKGMKIEAIKEFLGHESISTTQIYAKASPEMVKRELQTYDINNNGIKQTN